MTDKLDTSTTKSALLRVHARERGFMVGPILYILAIAGIGASVLFSGYSNILRTNIEVTRDNTTRNDLGAAAETLSASSALSTDSTILLPPAAMEFVDIPGADAAKLPTNYTNADDAGAPTTVGVYTASAGVKQLDPWGRFYIYCRWESEVATGSNPALMLVSAGPDGALDTDCGDTTAQNDDKLESLTVSQAINRANVWQVADNGGTQEVRYGVSANPVRIQSDGTILGASMTLSGNAAISGSITAASLDLTSALPLTEGGTGAATAAAARLNLGATSMGDYLYSGSTFSSSLGGQVRTTLLGSTTVGDALFTAADAGAGRTALGATTVGASVFTAADAAAGRTALGATTVGANLFTAADAAAGRTALGATTVGASVFTAADTDAAQTALGASAVGQDLFTAGTSAAARTTLNAGATGDSVFLSATPAEAWAALGLTGGSGTLNVGISGNASTADTATYLADGGNILAGTVPINRGGTGAASASAARTSLGADNASNLTTGTLDVSRHAVSGVTAGAYNWGTVDTYGRVTSANNVSTTQVSQDDSGVSVSDTGSDGSITFTTEGAVRMTIDPNGYVGIGTTTPAEKLHVKTGNIRLEGAAETSRFFQIATGTGLRWAWGGDDTAEGGSNAGSDFVLKNYDDSGAVIGTPLTVARSTGAAVFTGPVTSTGGFVGNITGNVTGNVSGNVSGNISGVISLSDGTAASPGLYFTSDTNTGIYRPGADTFAISTGGTGRLFVDGSGNVGIGIGAPSDSLHIEKTSGFGIKVGESGNRYLSLGYGGIDWSAGAGNLSINTEHGIDFKTDGTTRVTMDEDGNVGIGTATPAGILDVDGGTVYIGDATDTTVQGEIMRIRIGSSGAATGYVTFQRPNDTYSSFLIGYTAHGGEFAIRQIGDDQSTIGIQSSGTVNSLKTINFGAANGQVSQTSNFHNHSAGATTVPIRLWNNSTSANSSTAITFSSINEAEGQDIAQIVGLKTAATNYPNAVPYGGIGFNVTNGSTTLAEAMRIMPSGNVGIGTNAPDASSILELSTTGKGFLAPRMTTTERDAISSPATGLFVYNGTANRYQFYNGTAWTDVGYGVGGGESTGFAPGTVSAPGLAVTGDTDTGLFQAVADSVSIAGAATEIARFSAAGINIATGRLLIGGNNGLAVTTTGSTFVGDTAAATVATTGLNNTAVGYQALNALTTGASNTAVGYNALASNTSGATNAALGNNALTANTSGVSNVAIGYGALTVNTTGSSNVGVGVQAMQSVTTGNNNTALGNLALGGVTNGNQNIGLGFGAGDNITTGSANIVLGYDVDAPSATASSQLNIGNLLYGDIALAGTAKTALTSGVAFDINATNSFMLPKGTDAERPGTGVSGMARYNSTANAFEFHNGTTWIQLSGTFAAAGVSGSVQFSNGTTFAADSTNFFWDDTNNRLGIGTDTPTVPLDVTGIIRTTMLRIVGQTGGAGTNGVEQDPQVNSLTSGKFCTTDGSVINCTSDAPSLATNFDAGTAGAPGLYVTGDTNTGLFQASADTVSISGAGAEVARFTGVASAANYLNHTAAISGSAPILAAAGSDTNIGLTIDAKGSGVITLADITTISGAATAASTLDVTGNFAINTNKFNVTASSGDTAIAGTLGVTGAATLSSTLGVTGNLAVNTNKFNVTASSGDTAIAGTLGVTGATTLSSTLGVTGDAAFDTNTLFVDASSDAVGIGTTSITTGAALDIGSKTSSVLLPKGTTGERPGTPVAGMARYNSTTTSFEYYNGTAWTALSGTLGAAGSTGYLQFNSGGVLGSDSNLFWDDTNNRLGLNNASPAYSLDVTGTANVTGVTTLGSTLDVTGNLAINTNKFNVTAASGNTTVAGTLGVTGAATFTSTATAASFIPSSSTAPTNGMYLAAADTLGLATASAERVRIDSSGNMGVGGTPVTRLDVAGTLKVADGGETCGVSYAGAIKYASGSIYFCNGSGWTTVVSGTSSVTNFAAGTSGSPGFYVAGDPNTGLFQATADTLSIAGNGFEALRVSTTGTAVNYLSVQGVATGSAPTISSAGTDTNIDVRITPKGSGGVKVTTGNLDIEAGNYRLAGAAVLTIPASNSLVVGSGGASSASGQSNNTIVGRSAMAGVTIATDVVAVGYNALTANTSGSYNTAVGALALDANTTASYNTAFGYGALGAVTTGANNTAIGYNAGDNITTGSSNIIIGYDVDAASATGSNQLNIGNTIYGDTSTGNVGIGTASPGSKLTISGGGFTTTEEPSLNIITSDTVGASLGLLSTDTGGRGWLVNSAGTASAGAGAGSLEFFDMEAFASRLVINTNGNVGIGTVAPVASAILELSTTTKGFLPPRMTTTQRDAVSSPAEGLTVYNTTTDALNVYNGSAWAAVGSGGSGLTVGSSSITSGTTTKVLYNNAGVVGEYTISGTGNVAMTTSPTFVTPALGTPSAAVLTNATGLPISTGVSGLGTDVATALATPSSANLATAITDETGTGALVFGTAPTFTTSATAPLVIGGTGTTSTLTLKTTTGVGTTNADMIFQVGNNGATEAMRILNSGNVGIGITSPVDKFEVAGGIHTSSNAAASKASEAWLDYLTASNLGRIGAMGPDTSTNAAFAITSYRSNGSNAITLFHGTAAGNVGIGTSSPSYKLTVNRSAGASATADIFLGDGTQYAMLNSNSSAGAWNPLVSAGDTALIYTKGSTESGTLVIGPHSASAKGIRIDADGDVGIGTATTTYKFTVAASGGTGYLSDGGVWVNASDRRLKENIKPIQYGLDTVMKLRPVSYDMKAGHEKQIGFIAQEVEELVPEVVGKVKTATMDDQRTLSYDQMVAVTVKAIQELKAENDNLKQQVAALSNGAGTDGGHAEWLNQNGDSITVTLSGKDMVLFGITGGLMIALMGMGALAWRMRRELLDLQVGRRRVA